MNTFYQTIAKHYDDIFPLSDTLRTFLSSFSITKDDRVLDIGCATGEVALYLAQSAHHVTGIDLDPDLIVIAQSKKSESNRENVTFLVGNMNDLGGMFPPCQFRVVLCLGNTLVHLLSINKIDLFFENVANILSNGGLFIFQILNYGKICARKTVELPLISNEKIAFERRYDHEAHKPLLAFNTRLTIKKTSEIIDNSIDLYPLKREEITRLPSRHLFRSTRFLGGFDNREFTPGDDLLIGIWVR